MTDEIEALADAVADKIREEAMWGPVTYHSIATGIVFAISRWEELKVSRAIASQEGE